MSDDWDDDEWDDDGWSEEPEEVDTKTCRNCGAEIYEEAEQCPTCGEYVLRGSTSVLQGKPTWYVWLALLGIAAVIFTLVFR